MMSKISRNYDNCYVLASYFNHKADPQRKEIWDPDDFISVLPLISSVVSKKLKIKIFHNCFKEYPEIENCEWIRVDPNPEFVPNVARWFIQKEWIEKNQDIVDAVFMVDSTDVEMLRNPFKKIREGVLYCGDEVHNKVENKWMKTTQEPLLKIPDYRSIIEENKDHILLNCGIFGGYKSQVLDYLTKLCMYHSEYSNNVDGSTDMSVFNYTMFKHFKEIYEHGPHVNTKFKFFEYNETSWWKHK
jgi:hypothetical protein